MSIYKFWPILQIKLFSKILLSIFSSVSSCLDFNILFKSIGLKLLLFWLPLISFVFYVLQIYPLYQRCININLFKIIIRCYNLSDYNLLWSPLFWWSIKFIINDFLIIFRYWFCITNIKLTLVFWFLFFIY